MGGEKKWQKMKRVAEEKGSITHQGVVLTPDFFRTIEENVPSQSGEKFKHPVLVVYNTEDYVVLPETSLACAKAYKNAEVTKVTSEKSPHGYEMSFKHSKLKEQLTEKIIEYFRKNL